LIKKGSSGSKVVSITKNTQTKQKVQKNEIKVKQSFLSQQPSKPGKKGKHMRRENEERNITM